MRQQLNHMVLVEELFKARLLDEQAPHRATNTEAVPRLQALTQRLAACNAWATDYLARSNSAQLGRLVVFVFADRQNGAMTCEEMLFHLINHGTYHRGGDWSRSGSGWWQTPGGYLQRICSRHRA
jgi:uncharacterized damage-inducible protein DinB